MFIKETWVNATGNYICGGSDLYEPCTQDIGQIFRGLQQEYGRCVSKMYVDIKDKARVIGWVFQKIRHYEDTGEPYLAETWIELHRKMPRVKKTHYYHFID